jgi:hypothetical protein
MKKITLILSLLLISNIGYAENNALYHLQEMLDAYKALSNYEDRGSSITKYIKSDNDTHSDEINFHTKYIENKSLYFEWQTIPSEREKSFKSIPSLAEFSKPQKYTVWKDKTGIFSKYPYEEKEHNSLSSALSGATGISSGIAWMAPRYLSPDISCAPGFGALNLKTLKSTPSSVVIQLTYKSGTIAKMHIDTSTYLLRKYEDTSELSSGTKTYQVTHFNVINKY